MSSQQVPAQQPGAQDHVLTVDVLAHLDAQLRSTRSLLGVVLEQGAAIRVRDVQGVVRLAGILRGEMGRRQLLEEQRSLLLTRAGERLGMPARNVTSRPHSTSARDRIGWVPHRKRRTPGAGR